MNLNRPLTWMCGIFSWVLLSALPVSAVTNRWTGAVNNDWFEDGNWSEGIRPVAGQSVLINTNSSAIYTNVLLTNSTPWLAGFVISNRLMTFSNWTTALQATNVAILKDGVLTLPAAFTNAQMSNRVHVVCSNLTIEVGGLINGLGLGFAGGNLTSGFGPGKGTAGSRGSGAGYGGRGGDGARTTSFRVEPGGGIYGLTSAPADPGSGGGAYGGAGSWGGPGGGMVRIDASGDVVVDGQINCDGGDSGPYGGGGSGGGIYLTSTRFGGTGVLTARGGVGKNEGGGGGGGRIAIDYQEKMGVSVPILRCHQGAGLHNGWFVKTVPQPAYAAQMGTIWMSRTNLLANPITNLTGYLFVDGFTDWSPPTLTVRVGMVGFEPGFNLDILGGLTVEGGGGVLMGTGSFFRCGGDCQLTNGTLIVDQTRRCQIGGDLILTNGGSFYAASGPTNGTSVAGVDVMVTGALYVAASSWVYPICDWTNGGAPRFQVGSLWVNALGGFNADGRGFKYGYASDGWGPGKGLLANVGSGAGYGGRGGWSYWGASTPPWRIAGGSPYGSSNAPILPGSGGAGGSGGDGRYGASGGGVIWVESRGGAVVNGTLSAGGANGGYNSGAGSGGGIFLSSATLSGAGTLVAHGGSGDGTTGGDGGGGRIAVAVGMERSDLEKLIAGQTVADITYSPAYSDFGGTLSVSEGTGTIGDGDTSKYPLPGGALFIELERNNPAIMIHIL